jgi:LytS/YehU family sensor histidine kinase
MSSKNNETFPNKYKDILDIRPIIKSNGKEEKCCSYGSCVVFSPIVLPVWLTCFLGVTIKKIYYCCSKKSSLEDGKQTTQSDTTTIHTQPQPPKFIAPKELLLNPRLK